MVQDQLVEYVSSQLKLGIARDTIKAALTGVGWAPLDVEDTLKKVEGNTASSSAVLQPAAAQKTAGPTPTATASPKLVSFSMPGTAASQVKSPEPQTVRVSDLVSTVAPASSMPPAGTAPKIISSGTMSAGQAAMKPFAMGNSSFTAGVMQKKKGIGLLGVLAIVLIILLGALSGYLFLKNSSLDSQLQAQGSGTQSLAQSSASQIQALNASNTTLAAEVASATAANQDLTTNLSFFTPPVGMPTPATSTQVSVSGVLSAGLGKNTYIITTPYGVKVYVKNSTDKGVAAALQPLLGTTVQLSGTYIPGTPNITVSGVNGTPTTLPPVATTTPASSTPATP
jgi:hypothetical protein